MEWLIGTFVVLAVVAIGLWVSKRKETPPVTVHPPTLPTTEEKAAPASARGLGDRLARTRGSLKEKLTQYFSGEKGAQLSNAEWDSIEEILLEGDVGVQTTQTLISRVKERQKKESQAPLKALFESETEGLLAGLNHGEVKTDGAVRPYVISVVGINGVGKTTTIGKLAQSFKNKGSTVLLGAVDTFRAGAINQLKVWSERTGADFVTGREGADPGAVAFDSVTAGKAREKDIVLLDTAGRLHTKANLMEELKKIHRVVKKVIPEAPHETWLVIDGTLGQNSIQQAKEFQKALEITGIIITKLDGTAKGGAVLAIAQDLKVPIRYIGVGEAVEDLIPFEPRAFVEAVLGT